MISVRFPDKPFNIKVIQVYIQPLMPKKLKLNGSMKTYWRRKWQSTPILLPGKSHGQRSLVGYSLWGLLELTPKRCPFHHRGLECKRRKSRDTWSNRQICPWSTKQSRSKANRVLPRECNGHSKHPLPTKQEKTLHKTSPDGQHRNLIRSIICRRRCRNSIQSAKIRPGADCGPAH